MDKIEHNIQCNRLDKVLSTRLYNRLDSTYHCSGQQFSLVHFDSKLNNIATPQASLDVLPLEKSSLWWAGKEMLRGKPLGDYVGKNEKTKIICKLQKV